MGGKAKGRRMREKNFVLFFLSFKNVDLIFFYERTKFSAPQIRLFKNIYIYIYLCKTKLSSLFANLG